MATIVTPRTSSQYFEAWPVMSAQRLRSIPLNRAVTIDATTTTTAMTPQNQKPTRR